MMGWADGSPSRSSEGCLLTISSWPMRVFPGKLVDLEGLRKMLSGQLSQFSGSREPAVSFVSIKTLIQSALILLPSSIREMNRRQTYEQANKIYDKAMKLEQEFGEYFTGKKTPCCPDWVTWAQPAPLREESP